MAEKTVAMTETPEEHAVQPAVPVRANVMYHRL